MRWVGTIESTSASLAVIGTISDVAGNAIVVGTTAGGSCVDDVSAVPTGALVDGLDGELPCEVMLDPQEQTSRAPATATRARLRAAGRHVNRRSNAGSLLDGAAAGVVGQRGGMPPGYGF